MFKKYLIFLLLFTKQAYAVVTIQASSLSCTTPTVLHESAIIELDVPLEITGLCALLSAGSGFGSNDTVTFRPTTTNTITISSETIVNTINIITAINPGIWDVRSFNSGMQTFIFESVLMYMDPGATIVADGLTFQLLGTSQLITNPISTTPV